MFHPTSKGAVILYDSFVLPYFKQIEKDIDDVAKGVEGYTAAAAKGLKDKAGFKTN